MNLPIFREALRACRTAHGDKDPSTLVSKSNLGLLLHARGSAEGAGGGSKASLERLREAEGLLRGALNGMREVHGDTHRNTLGARGNLSDLLRERGELDAAHFEMGDALALATAALGASHADTLVLAAKAARIFLARTGDEAPLRDVVRRMETALGVQHQQLQKYAAVVHALGCLPLISR